MSRRGWIIVLIAGGIGLAILIGVLGTRNEPSETKAEATAGLCTSLQGLDTSLKQLTSQRPTGGPAARVDGEVDRGVHQLHELVVLVLLTGSRIGKEPGSNRSRAPTRFASARRREAEASGRGRTV